MLVVRRIYLYLVSAISLITITWAAIGLARLVISEGIGEGQIIGLASLLATIIVGLPIFLFHWLMAQRLAAANREEAHSSVRQFYFYGVMAAGAAPVLSNIYRLLDKTLVALVGGILPDGYPYSLTLAEHLVTIVLWAVIWAYLWRLSRPLSDRQTASTLDFNLSIRRFYLLVFALGGLIMLSWGAVGLLQTLMQAASLVIWQTPVANYSAQMLAGAAIWAGHWLVLQRDFAAGYPGEERSVLRKVYLYFAVFSYSIMALSSGTGLFKRLIELALGAPPSSEPLLTQLSIPVPLLIVGIVWWAYHWYVLRDDARQAPEAPRQAGVRRIYAYLVAALGLIVLLTGIVGLLLQLTDLLTTPAVVGLDFYREEFALYTSMILVGLPVWLLPWRVMQRLAVQRLPQADTTGIEERRSTVRKIYLYFFVFIASLGIFGSVGWFIFHILTALLGADLPDDFITLVLNALVIALLAIGVWLYHWQAIRRDGQMESKAQSQRLSDITVVVIDGDEGQLGRRILHHLAAELPGLQLKPVGVTSQAVEAMGGQPFAVNTFEMAHYIIGSWQTLTTPQVAPALAGATATKFVVPLAAPQWIWAGVNLRSLDSYARQSVLGLKQAIAGEEISFGREMDTATIVAIIIGAIILLCIGGGLISALLGIFL